MAMRGSAHRHGGWAGTPGCLLLAALVASVPACAGGERTAVGSISDTRKVAPPERAPAVDAAPPRPLASDGAPPPAVDAAGEGSGSSPTLGPSESPGTVELRLVVPAGRSYCDQGSDCNSPGHISIRDLAGSPLHDALPHCPIRCDSICVPPPCLPCAAMGIAFTGQQRIWDGQVHPPGTCGMNITCQQTRHVPAGRYVAVMCATPGQLEAVDGGQPTCRATGPQQCIEVPFDLPSAMPVVGHLP